MVTAFSKRLAALSAQMPAERKPLSQEIVERMTHVPYAGFTHTISSERREELVTLGREIAEWLRDPLSIDVHEHSFDFWYLTQLVNNATELQVVVNQIVVEDFTDDQYRKAQSKGWYGGKAPLSDVLSCALTEIEVAEDIMLPEELQVYPTSLLAVWVMLDEVQKRATKNEPHMLWGTLFATTAESLKRRLFEHAVKRYGIPLAEVER